MATLKELETEISLDTHYQNLTDQQWIAKSALRGLTHRSQVDFDWWEGLYPKKITALRGKLAGDWTFDIKVSDDGKALNSAAERLDAMNAKMDEWYYCQAKEIRLLDKLAAVIEEQRLRKDEIVVRTDLHEAADYYIDYDNGNDATNDGTSAVKTNGDGPFKTITKFTTVEARVPGDRAFLRAGITWDQGTEAVDITFDEDGTADAYLSLIGCDSVTNDPWSDASDVKPIIDFENAAYQITLSADNYWWIERLDVRQGNDNLGMMWCNANIGTYMKACNFQDAHTASFGVRVSGMFLTLDGCTFTDCQTYSTFFTSAAANMKGCTFTAGVDVSTNYGVYQTGGGDFYLSDCVFSGSFDTKDILVGLENSFVYCRNVTWSGSGEAVTQYGAILSEDDDATFESHLSTLYQGTITRATASPRGGGADSYAVIVPNANCGVNSPLVLGNPMSGFARVWVTKDIEINVAVWARVGSAWDGALTAAQCYAKFSYLSNAATAARVELQSTEIISNVADWTTGVHALTSGAFTPLQTGWVYMWFNVAHWEDASEEVWVDIKPVIS